MSPNEAQLRAALHEGEGDPLDANRLIRHAQGVRHERRRRVVMASGAAAVVALSGLGAAALAGGPGQSGSGGASVADRPALNRTLHAGPQSSAAGGAAPARSRPAAGLPRNTGRAFSSASGSPCPATPERLMLPGGGGSGQFGSTGPLFPRPVDRLTVCAYPDRVNAGLRTVTLSGSGAAAAASGLSAAPATKSYAPCPPNADYVAGTFELLAADARGRPMRPVVVTVGCPTSEATNGTAVRYVSDLPESFVNLLDTVSPRSSEPSSAHS